MSGTEVIFVGPVGPRSGWLVTVVLFQLRKHGLQSKYRNPSYQNGYSAEFSFIAGAAAKHLIVLEWPL